MPLALTGALRKFGLLGVVEPGWGGPGKDEPQGLRLPIGTNKTEEVQSSVAESTK